MSNSDRSRRKLTEQSRFEFELTGTTYTVQQHDVDDTRQESLIRTKPGNRIHLALEMLNMTFSSRPPQRRTILKDWENKCIVATEEYRGVHKDTLLEPQNTNSLSDTRDNTKHIVFECEPAVELHAKNINFRTSANGNPRLDQVTIGMADSPI